MKINKYLFFVIMILLVILVDIILFAFPASIDRGRSIIESVPMSFWILLLLYSGVIVFIALKVRSKVSVMLLSVLFFFVFYAFNLFFIIVPQQTDIGATSMFMRHLSRNIYIDPALFTYFTCPIYFTSGRVIMDVLGLSYYGTTNLGFFVYLLAIPLVLPLTMVKFSRRYPASFIIYPAAYIILTFFFINSQFIPQFVGLIFMLLTIGSYVRLQETKNVIYYYLTIVFFILCVYSHPFMFFFFLMAVIIKKTTEISTSDKLEKIKEFLRTSDSIGHVLFRLFNIAKDVKQHFISIQYFTRNKIESFIGISGKKDISLILLIAIYIYGYKTRFFRFEFIEDLLYTRDERGETWFIVSYFLGSKTKVGLASFENYPLYDLVPGEIHLLLRYVNIIILFLFVALITISLIKVSKKHINFFDIYLFGGSLAFMAGGFFNYAILGQRAVQVMFVNTPQYIGRMFKNSRFMIIIIAMMITGPILFNLNYSVNTTISGFGYIEDNGSIIPGEFIEDFSLGNQTVFVSFRSFYPVASSSLQVPEKMRMYREAPGSLRDENYTLRTDLIIDNDKIKGNMHYWGIQENIFDDINNTIYDQGDGRILIRGSKVHKL
ncbi:MAG: hypothetical protein QCI82_02015 [Candidatus Thermoplasmatota archaeon]|nr:hypothetical protein [Candidatus Thermoplasmatota archaeon]